MLTMYDSVSVGQIPADAQAVAGYVGGNWPTYSSLERLHPDAHKLSIAVNAGEDADCLDVETGDATPADAPAWVRRQLARGVWRPCLYANASTMPAVVHALAQGGIARREIRLWVASYTGYPHIPNGYDACQWTNTALGRNLDASLCSDTFFAPTNKPPHRPARRRRPSIPAPHPKVAAGTLTGALGIVAVAILNTSGVHITAQLAAAISTVAASLGGYLTPARP